MFSWLVSLFGGEKKTQPSFVTEDEFMEFMKIVRQGFAAHRDRLSRIEEEIELLKQEKATQSDEALASLEERLADLYSRMDELGDSFEDLSARFSGLSEDVSRTRERLKSLADRISSFDEKFLELRMEMDKKFIENVARTKKEKVAKDIASLELPARESLTPLEMEIIKTLVAMNVNEGKKSVTLKELAQKIHDTTNVSAKIPTLSVYVSKLVYKGLLSKERCGQNVYISLNRENVANLLARLGYEQLAKAL